MNRFAAAMLFCFIVAVPATAAPRDALGILEGAWTIAGMEDSYLEVCRWFDDRSHMVCSSESREASGTKRGVSVFSYSEEQERFLYYRYGSSGRVTAQDVFIDGATLHATAERTVKNGLIRMQVTMARRDDGSFDFVRQESHNGGPWKTVTTLRYVRARNDGGVR